MPAGQQVNALCRKSMTLTACMAPMGCVGALGKRKGCVAEVKGFGGGSKWWICERTRFNAIYSPSMPAGQQVNALC